MERCAVARVRCYHCAPHNPPPARGAASNSLHPQVASGDNVSMLVYHSLNSRLRAVAVHLHWDGGLLTMEATQNGCGCVRGGVFSRCPCETVVDGVVCDCGMLLQRCRCLPSVLALACTLLCL